MWVRSPGQEDDLDEGMATHSSILTWRISWTEEPGMLQSQGRTELDMTESTYHACMHCSDNCAHGCQARDSRVGPSPHPSSLEGQLTPQRTVLEMGTDILGSDSVFSRLEPQLREVYRLI